jgi:hypothetical protein
MRSRNAAPGDRISATPLVPSATPSVLNHAPDSDRGAQRLLRKNEASA